MIRIDPDTGARVVTIGEGEGAFPAALYEDDGGNPVLLQRLELDAAERRRVADGEDIYVAQHTYNRPVQRLDVQVGDAGWRPSRLVRNCARALCDKPLEERTPAVQIPGRRERFCSQACAEAVLAAEGG